MATTTATAAAPRFRLRLPDAVSALGERDFRTIWLGQAVSLCGTWMQVVAQGLLVLQLWDSAFALGAVNVTSALPAVVVMLFGGVLADRMEKRRILVATQVALAALAFAIGLLVVSDHMQFWMLLIIIALGGIAIGYDMPAYSSFLPELVPPEKIGQVVALNSATFHGSRMVGPAIAGVVIAVMGLAGAFLLNGASFIAVIFSLLIVRYRPKPRAAWQQAGSMLDGLREGLRHTNARPHLRAMLLLSALNMVFVFPGIAVMMPYYATKVLDAGSTVLSLLFVASGVGSVLGALALIWWGRYRREQQFYAAAALAPAALLVLAVSRDPATSIVASGFGSLAFSYQFGLLQIMSQESTPQEFRGRVTSLFSLAFNGFMPLAALATSGLAVAIGLPAVLTGSAVLFAVGALLLLRFAAGGIGNVVRATHVEYEVIAAGG